MKPDRSLDRESFQTFLANAFLVQDSGIDARSLSAFVKIQRSIATGACNMDNALRLIAEHARNVAGATGVAIALLETDQLVYRAGSGSASGQVGRHVTAVLSAPAHHTGKEILRVENAQEDSRIEADICRQYGGTSLLMLPIYREHVVAGVMEVIFSEEHTFRDHEVRAYRLLTGLVEDAMGCVAASGKLADEQSETIPQAVAQIVSQVQKFYGDDAPAPMVSPEPWLQQACAAAAGGSPKPSPSTKSTAVAAVAEKNVFLSEVLRKATAAAAAGALLIIGWVAFMHHGATVDNGTVSERSNLAVSPMLPDASKPLPTVPSDTRGVLSTTSERRLPGFTRKRVNANEVDYIADDVTMKVFTPRYNAPPAQRWTRQVKYGNDVTVRYFANQPAGRAGSTAGDQPDHSSSVSK